MPGLLYFHGGIGVFGSVRTHDAVCRMLCADAAIAVLSSNIAWLPSIPIRPGCRTPPGPRPGRRRTLRAWASIRARLAIGGDPPARPSRPCCARKRATPVGRCPPRSLLLCPVTDPPGSLPSRAEFGDGYFLSRALLDWGLDQVYPPGIDRRDPRIAPLRATDLTRLPPARIHTAEFDPFRDEGAAYAQGLAAAGVEVGYVCHAGLIHHYYGMAGAIPAARQALREAALGCAICSGARRPRERRLERGPGGPAARRPLSAARRTRCTRRCARRAPRTCP